MALWMTALKMVPWGEVIQAAPHVVKAAKNLLRKDAATPAAATSAAETLDVAQAAHSNDPLALALQHIAMLQQRVAQLEQSQHEATALIEQMARQQAQIVQTVGLLRTGATRLAWACGLLGLGVAGLLAYIVFVV